LQIPRFTTVVTARQPVGFAAATAKMHETGAIMRLVKAG